MLVCTFGGYRRDVSIAVQEYNQPRNISVHFLNPCPGGLMTSRNSFSNLRQSWPADRFPGGSACVVLSLRSGGNGLEKFKRALDMLCNVAHMYD